MMLIIYSGSDLSTLTFDFLSITDATTSPRLTVIFDRDPPGAHWYFTAMDDSDYGVLNPTVLQRFGLEPTLLSPEDTAEVAAFVGTDPALAILVAESGLFLPG